MSSQRHSGFGIGFSKEVDSILAASQLGHLYPDEVRENLRIAGMVLQRAAVMPEFTYEEPADDYADEAIEPVGLNEGDDDE